MNEPRSDDALLAAAAAGSLDAFNAFVLRHQDALYGFCARMVGPDRCEDATQEAFVRAWRAVGRYRPGFPRAWLYRIASNVCLDLLRRERRRPASLRIAGDGDAPIAELPDSAPGPESRAEQAQLRAALERALAELTAEHRAAVLLCDLQGWPLAEAAGALGVPEGTLKSRLHRAHERLRRSVHLEPLRGA